MEYACWRCSCSSLKWIEPRHRLQVTSCHPHTTRERRRLRVRRWPQAVCSRSVSHRWIGCSIEDLHRCCQGRTGAVIAQTARGTMLPWSVPSWRLPACPTREWGSRSCTFAVRILLRALPLSCSFTPVCSRDHLSQPYQSLRRYLNRAREQFHGRLVEARASSRLCPAGGPAYSFHGYDSIVCTSP